MAYSGTSVGMGRPGVFVTHPVFREAAFGSHHPLSIGRQAAVMDLCQAMGWLTSDRIHHCQLASREDLLKFHDARYVDALEAACERGEASVDTRQRYNVGTMECPLFDGLWERARASVGGSMRAAELAVEGHVAFHPAGGTHHGRPERASGFCYFNDPVFAIMTLLERGIERVLYLDLDAHHGDGVEDAYSGDGRVMTVSLHEAGRWPYSGETGWDDEKATLNIALPGGVNDSEYAFVLEQSVLPRVERWEAQAAVVECGADALAGDPLSSLQLSNGALWRAVERFVAPVPGAVVLGGGGYNPWTAARLWAGLWARLSGQVIPVGLPGKAEALLAALSCDLVDDEDVVPRWLTAIDDVPNEGAIRPEIDAIVKALG